MLINFIFGNFAAIINPTKLNNEMSIALTRIPLDKMSNTLLQEYAITQILDWPFPLSKAERDALFLSMWNSVVSMKLKCMSQTERDEVYAARRKMESIKKQVEEQVKERKHRLKTHHIYI